MIFNYEEKTINIKIVYYGPAMSGKTTTIKFLFSYFNKEKHLESIESTVGRTLFFDFGVLQFNGAEWSLKFLLYSATGQDFYASTRPSTLTGVDGIIFVADSQAECLEHNIRSWSELKVLFGEDFYNIPIVIALNKDDMAKNIKMNEDNLTMGFNIGKFNSISIKKTTAINGIGVLDTFKEIIGFIFPQLNVITV